MRHHQNGDRGCGRVMGMEGEDGGRDGMSEASKIPAYHPLTKFPQGREPERYRVQEGDQINKILDKCAHQVGLLGRIRVSKPAIRNPPFFF